MARHRSDLAGHSHFWGELCDPAIFGLEFPRALAGRRGGLADFNGVSRPVPQGLATEADLANIGHPSGFA